MKLLTLNTNSYQGENPTNTMANLCEVIADSDYDVIALQEVNQEYTADEVKISELDNYIPAQDRVPVKADNYVYQIVQALGVSGQRWYWTWLPTHVGWNHYDEGLALLTRHPILKTNAFYVSKTTDYNNPKTRMALGILTEYNGKKEWYYSVHFDHWNDAIEPFDQEWDRFVNKAIETAHPLFVMGDFGNDAEVKNEAYEYVLNTTTLTDTFPNAEYHDSGVTVDEYIPGWENKDHPKAIRTDFIFTNSDMPVLSSEIVFNGAHKPKVSDHYGLEVTFGEKMKVYKVDLSREIPEFTSSAVFALPPILSVAGALTNISRINTDPIKEIIERFREKLDEDE